MTERRYSATSWQRQQVANARDEKSRVCVPLAITLRGPLDVERLRAALAGLVARHEALRTRFVEDDAGVWAVVSETVRIEVPIVAPEDIARELARPVAMTGPYLWRAALHVCGPNEHVLTLCGDHSIMDGRSTQIIVRDLAALYGCQPVALGAQLSDYAAWEARAIHPGDREYWATTLTPMTTRLNRPALDAADTIPAFLHPLPGVPRTRLRALMGSYRVPMAALLTALTLRAIDHAAPDRMAVGLLVSGRDRGQWANVVGLLADVMPVPAKLGKGFDLELTATTVADAVWDSEEHDVPLRAIRDLLDPTPGEPLFDVGVNYLPGGGEVHEAAGVTFAGEMMEFGRQARTLDGWYDAAALVDVVWREQGDNVVGYLCANGLPEDAALPREIAARLTVLTTELSQGLVPG